MRYILYWTVINVIFYTLDDFVILLHILGRLCDMSLEVLPENVGKNYNGPK
jgi:hypothetical protein